MGIFRKTASLGSLGIISANSKRDLEKKVLKEQLRTMQAERLDALREKRALRKAAKAEPS